MSEFANIELALIEPSLTNPRKTFNPVKLDELVESIKASGVHAPVLVRPLPGSRVEETSWEPNTIKPRTVRPAYELVAGERRLRASITAGLATIPAMIRDLTDDQVLEIQIVENLQRDDLTELEEAEGYQALMDHGQVNADAVGSKIGKSRSYVFARLKLLDLCQQCKHALREGQIDASRALLIARIPDTALQVKALTEATRANALGEVASVRNLQIWLQANVMLRLERAVFNIADRRLVASAGSCKDCPKRTGANPDLFADVDGADICTDPVCFHGKEDAHRAVLKARADKNGQRFIEGKEAQEICNKYTSRLDGYLPLDQVRADLAPEHSGKTLRTLLGKDFPGIVLIENPYTKELVEAVPDDAAETALEDKGMFKPEAFMVSKDHITRRLEGIEKSIKNDTGRKVRARIYQATAQAVRGTTDDMAKTLLGSHFLRAYLLTQMEELDTDDMAMALGYTFQDGEDEVDGLTQFIRACSVADLCRAAIIVMSHSDSHCYYADTEPLMVNALVAMLDVPVKQITKAATKEVLDDYAEERKELQAQIDAMKAPAAAAAAPAPAVAPATKARKPKLSAGEAQAAIAAAMQATPSPGDNFAVGQRVKITTDDNKLGLIARKFAGKVGVITRREDGGGYWDVTFKGRTGGICQFADDQLEVVAEEVEV
jgi:ParB/RepB/Spo0J family partition protein